jgi:D-beta-D-heptose 7-phosphate kinase/D-beta-D-heptose 1-phosphate adenosyltransferase
MNIWVNGCFDILHIGHLNLLEFAKNLRDQNSKFLRLNRLIVGIDSDRRIKELKGTDRPINNENDRKRMLESLAVVDEVVIYDTEEQMCDFISTFNIDYIVVGDDYKDKKVLCREFSENDVVFFTKDEHSSSDIIDKIKKS